MAPATATIQRLSGSLPWCLALAWLGAKIGENYHEVIHPWFHRFDLVIGAVILAGAAYFIRSRVIAFRSHPEGPAAS